MVRKKKRDSDFAVTAFRVVQEATADNNTTLDHADIELVDGKNPAAVALGRLGGLKRSNQQTPEQRKELARKAAKARWNKEQDGINSSTR